MLVGVEEETQQNSPAPQLANPLRASGIVRCLLANPPGVAEECPVMKTLPLPQTTTFSNEIPKDLVPEHPGFSQSAPVDQQAGTNLNTNLSPKKNRRDYSTYW